MSNARRWSSGGHRCAASDADGMSRHDRVEDRMHQIHCRTSSIIGIGQYFLRLGIADESIHTYQPPDQCGGEIWIYGTKRNEILLS